MAKPQKRSRGTFRRRIFEYMDRVSLQKSSTWPLLSVTSRLQERHVPELVGRPDELRRPAMRRADAHNNLACDLYDLGRKVNEGMTKPFPLPAQGLARQGDQAQPRPQTPRDLRAHQKRAVGQEPARRHAESVQAVLGLLDGVLLVAPTVRESHDFDGGHLRLRDVAQDETVLVTPEELSTGRFAPR